jgi:hypothetical protein
MISAVVRPLNLFEDAECRVDNAGKGNLNFCIVSSYTGPLNASVVQSGLAYLQKMHPLLRMSPNTTERITAFVETSAQVPFQELTYQSSQQWRSIVKEELKPRFNKLDQPLWRVCLLAGENHGQLIVTFHHAIADGVCGMPMMDHLYQIMSLILSNQPIPSVEFNDHIPELYTLYEQFPSQEPPDDMPIEIIEEKANIQDFLCDVVEKITTQNMIAWSKANNVKVHSILFAALLFSVRDVLHPDENRFLAMTAVNYRSSFKPAFSKHVLALMRTLINEEFEVPDNCDLKELAKAINASVHAQLDAGQHVMNLKALEKRIQCGASPQELLQRSKFPPHAVTQTNVGALEFSGDYPHSDLSLNELFFYADVTPFCETRTNVILGTLTFRDKVFLSLWFLEALVQESEAQGILTKMKEHLTVFLTHAP